MDRTFFCLVDFSRRLYDWLCWADHHRLGIDTDCAMGFQYCPPFCLDIAYFMPRCGLELPGSQLKMETYPDEKFLTLACIAQLRSTLLGY